MSGPPPKPANIRQRTNRKPGAATITALDGPDVPEIPNPDGRVWLPLTVTCWELAWKSPMASQWLDSDVAALGRVAMLWDAFYRTGNPQLLSEMRLQEQRFGLSPLDRSRLQWEVSRADEAEQKQTRRAETAVRRTGTGDPRRGLMAVK